MSTRRYYFAYGSNIHLWQMVERCPSSVFKGKAVLWGYRWQINQRGVANVIKSQEDYVEGLLFSIGEKDEKTLDRNEGVSQGFYEKAQLSVEGRLVESDFKTSYVARKIDTPGLKSIIGSASKPIIRRTNRETRPDYTYPKGDLKVNSDGHGLSNIATYTADGSGNEQIDSRGKSHLVGFSADLNDPGHAVDVLGEQALYEGGSKRTNSCGSNPHSRTNQNSQNHDIYIEEETTTVEALVYLSNTYRKDGNIREEYVARMEDAMADAEKLGISSEFLNKYLKPAIYDSIIIINRPEKVKESGQTFGGDHVESSGKNRRKRHRIDDRSRYGEDEDLRSARSPRASANQSEEVGVIYTSIRLAADYFWPRR